MNGKKKLIFKDKMWGRIWKRKLRCNQNWFSDKEKYHRIRNEKE
jgi:hypothetical protein